MWSCASNRVRSRSDRGAQLTRTIITTMFMIPTLPLALRICVLFALTVRADLIDLQVHFTFSVRVIIIILIDCSHKPVTLTCRLRYTRSDHSSVDQMPIIGLVGMRGVVRVVPVLRLGEFTFRFSSLSEDVISGPRIRVIDRTVEINSEPRRRRGGRQVRGGLGLCGQKQNVRGATQKQYDVWSVPEAVWPFKTRASVLSVFTETDPGTTAPIGDAEGSVLTAVAVGCPAVGGTTQVHASSLISRPAILKLVKVRRGTSSFLPT